MAKKDSKIVDIAANDEEEILNRVRAAQASPRDEEDTTEQDEYRLAESNRGGEIQPALDLSRTLTVQDMKLPRLKLLQGMSRECRRDDNPLPQGKWFLEGTDGVLGNDVLFVPLFQFSHRVKMIPGQGPVCRSKDTVQGVGDPGILCAACTEKDWDPNQPKVPPACSQYYNYPSLLLIEDDDPQIGLITLGKTSADAGKLLNTAWLNGLKQKKDWYDSTYRLGREQRTLPKGTFYAATVSRVGRTPVDILEQARDMVQVLDANAVRAAHDVITE